MANEGTDRAKGGWSTSGTPGLSPSDVQQKQFRTARLGGGYRMREVDEFLDRVTDALSALIAENERLRREQPSGDRAVAALAPASPAGPVDRAAIETFLQREKGFLQSLGSLVQDHAEELRGMVRSARAATREAPAAGSDRAEPQPSEPSIDEPAEGSEVQDDLAAVDPEAPAPADQEPAEIADRAPDDGDPADDEGPAGETGRALVTEETPTVAEDVAAADEEPIRLDEPEPARTRRRSEPAEGSLRELFWGED